MKFRVWMRLYSHQMDDHANFKPFYSATPLAPSEDGSKILIFDVEVPDDLFGPLKQVQAIPVTENVSSGDQQK